MNDEDVLMVASFGVRCSLLLFLYLYFFVLVLMLDFTIHILVILSEAEGSLTISSYLTFAIERSFSRKLQQSRRSTSSPQSFLNKYEPTTVSIHSTGLITCDRPKGLSWPRRSQLRTKWQAGPSTLQVYTDLRLLSSDLSFYARYR